ncbi:MAG TPA: sarcosine oxidase subunit delta [Castellaniella sp.]|uniref:sarcosine oxidase subunit delta n=1 Tax=Castellaniella sp. TaxID=1955812 RepID=UPI002F1086CA
MLLIRCPWCGERAESEFTYGGEAGIARPVDAAVQESRLTDAQWGDYLFMRTNSCGPFRELWLHAHGCRRWFEAERDTRTYVFKSTRPLGALEDPL